MVRIFLVEDHPIMRQSYALLIQEDPTLMVCGEAASGREVLEQLPQCAPDVIVVDISLAGDMSGIDLLKQLRTGQTATFIIFQTPEEGIGFPMSLKGFGEGFDKLS